MQSSDPAPIHHLYDDGDLYYYSMTDAILHRDLEQAGPELASYFNYCACGFNLADAGAGLEAQDVVDHFPVTAFGELTLQSDDINNMTVKGGNWTYSDPSVKAILDVCAAQKPQPLPFIFVSDACSVTTKPYRGDFEVQRELLRWHPALPPYPTPSPHPLERRRKACPTQPIALFPRGGLDCIILIPTRASPPIASRVRIVPPSSCPRFTPQYIGEIEMVCSHNRSVPCLWIGAGTFMRGIWDGYPGVVHALLAEHPNLYISLTPELISGKYDGLSRSDCLKLAKELPHRVVLGTTARGIFEGKPPGAFMMTSYADEVKALAEFATVVESECGAGIAASLRYRTAAKLFGMGLPDDPNAVKVEKKLVKDATTKDVITKARRESRITISADGAANRASRLSSANGRQMSEADFLRRMSYGGGVLGQSAANLAALLEEEDEDEEAKPTPADGKNLLSFFSAEASAPGEACPPSRAANKWTTIDCHLHLLDFLQKSSGTEAALKAMDGCDVAKAVVFGMPCCKKWCFYRPEQPLYYQDDNGPCYVYAYADQMVADAWLALDDERRARFAPCFASFDPTDLAALSHVKRMYWKYPKMWRGIGEVMCRHDDLTNMLLGKEVPRVNHPALDFIYEFAIQVDLPILVHHNSDRVGDNDDDWEYVHEVRRARTTRPLLLPPAAAGRCSLRFVGDPTVVVHPSSLPMPSLHSSPSPSPPPPPPPPPPASPPRSLSRRTAGGCAHALPDAQVRVGSRGCLPPLLRARSPRDDRPVVLHVQQPDGRHLVGGVGGRHLRRQGRGQAGVGRLHPEAPHQVLHRLR